MALLRGTVEEIIETNEDYIIARCHLSVRFDHSTFDFKFTKKSEFENIKEGYVWVMGNNYGERLKINRTPKDIKMMEEFNASLNRIIKEQQKKK